VITNTTTPAPVPRSCGAKQRGPAPDSYNLGVAPCRTFFEPDLRPATVTFKADGGAGNCSTTGPRSQYRFGGGEWRANGVRGGQLPALCRRHQRLVLPRVVAQLGASDTIHDCRSPSARRARSAYANQAGQTNPAVYAIRRHLTTPGNVTEGNGTVSSIAPRHGQQPGGLDLTRTTTPTTTAPGATDPQITAT